MIKDYFRPHEDKVWPVAAIIGILFLTIVELRFQGRLWLCSCGNIYVWAGNIHSSDNSQHLLDPYAFTHLLHGLVFFWVLALALPRLRAPWQLTVAVALEAVWEVFENSAFVIDRYREATIALGYEGDTVVNSMSDIVVCGMGFMLATYLGFRRSFALFALTELLLVVWIRDSLILNVVMLIYPVEAIKVWQTGS